jgi:hypothetical protein
LRLRWAFISLSTSMPFITAVPPRVAFSGITSRKSGVNWCT